MAKNIFKKDSSNVFGPRPLGERLHQPADRKYMIEIGEGAKFLQATNERLGRNFNFKISLYLKIFLTIFLGILIGRAAWLQLAKGVEYRQLADGNRLRVKRVEARRGIIYDRNNIPLVRNVANFMLYLIPADLPVTPEDRQAILSRLADLLDSDLSEVTKGLDVIQPRSYEAFQPLFVADNLPYDKAMLIYLESAKMPGVFLDSKNRREYSLNAISLSHILGYTGKINAEEFKKLDGRYSVLDYIGKNGLESFWESDLRGTVGLRQVEVDALGKEKRVISQSKVVDGFNLQLSVDATAQAKLEEFLKEELFKGGFKKASAIVSNPNNGEIISLISWPAYDNNVFARGISSAEYKALLDDPDQPFFNRSVTGEYPSGSTIKIVGVSAALNEGVIDENQTVLSNGGLRVGEWFFPDWKAGGHGLTNARKAIADSVNTYMYYIGGGFQDFQGLGVERLTKYYKLFGLGQETGIDLPNEANGLVPSNEWKLATKNERWYVGDTYHIAIGQGDLIVTPLQVNYYTMFFANGGSFYHPHLVHALSDENNNVIKVVESPVVAPSPVSENAIKVVREGMRQAVTSGSAKRLSTLPVTAGGKTGTAQFSTVKKPHAWFTGFAPYDNPEVAITILIEEGIEGSSSATAVADKFLRWYFGDRLSVTSTATSTPQ
ncbi:penicillin-binding protein 2 [Candidatus Falkowbacteria bacterium CG10_big_fil_rev_8_21_14_0_10_37_14]|uniref:Penicillin-binding protein 2 n=1 Tax=Candidatus Falkowbacteria bacterium CG10_big_fil_rev_8_21_14_0_10_37_14 TaxID=1974561 RepID=A0A2M6WSZ5_9BACT|nr:penicillin-binding protein 2 [Candidatus Falkowbacteria bacterium]PIT95933.1 MAG: penicillin-binding protein 2 [Candidatus Falkowbacteria bacterium CG10_big_fil_rev_8_21_14_0_10_37_14]